MAVSERFEGANVVDAGKLSPYWGEHAARYVLALSYVQDKTVLDIACGTGYGLGILQRTAKRVTGVDMNFEAASEARAECNDFTTVLLGNGLELPFRNESFDFVTSFETLEHLYERSKFLAELRRVLRLGGKLLMSTPNANYTNPVDGKPSNPFHIYEYTPDELRVELGAHFHVEKLMGQTLDKSIRIPPFYEAQMRLPKGIGTQVQLFGWKVLNKMPFALRESLSEMIWKKPFYPMENDYTFSSKTVERAPVLVAVCS